MNAYFNEDYIRSIDEQLEFHARKIYSLNKFSIEKHKKSFNVKIAQAFCALNPTEYSLDWVVSNKETPSNSDLGINQDSGLTYALVIQARGEQESRLRRAKESLSKKIIKGVDLPPLPRFGDLSLTNRVGDGHVPEKSHFVVALNSQNDQGYAEPKAYSTNSRFESQSRLKSGLEGKERVFDPNSALKQLKKEPYYADQSCFERRVDELPGSYIPFDEIDFLSKQVKNALISQWKVKSLYDHQVDAIKASLMLQHVLLLTGTGSGKTLCFASVMAERFIRFFNQRQSTFINKPRALLLYPTKALAQDQLQSIKLLLANENINVYAVDGDSSEEERMRAQQKADVILTNPDFLHWNILPRASNEWRQFVNSIELVVIDEAHTYNGAFGCHFAFVLRRLMRLVDQFPPSIFMCSATIGNPMETFERLTGLNVSLVTTVNDGLKSHDVFEDAVVHGKPSSNATSSSSASSFKALSLSSMVSPSNALFHGQYASSSSSSWMASKSNLIGPNEQQQQQRLSNPREMNPSLQGELKIVDKDASPQGSRLVVLWRPRVLKVLPDGREKRSSAIFETARVFTSLIRMGVRTLAFCKTRKLVELVLKYTYDLLSGDKRMDQDDEEEELKSVVEQSSVDTSSGGFHHSSFTFDIDKPDDDVSKSASMTKTTTTTTSATASKSTRAPSTKVEKKTSTSKSLSQAEKLKEKVLAYRAGYTKQERRDIERRMFSGELLGICCTSALELGIDIGTCDCVVVLGVTGASSTMQMFGRAGRKGRNALNICVTFDGALDRCLLKQPESFLERRAEESAVFDVRNEVIMKKHLLCAAKENPLDFMNNQQLDSTVFERELAISFCKSMVDLIEESPLRFRFHGNNNKPPHEFNIRMIMDGTTIQVIDEESNKALERSVEYVRAFYELYPGAIYMHQGRTYLITSVDSKQKKRALAKRVKVDYYTSAMDVLHINVVRVFEPQNKDKSVFTGTIELTRTLIGFKRVPFDVKNKYVDAGKFENKYFKMKDGSSQSGVTRIQYSTRATWIDLGSFDMQKEAQWVNGIHAVQHLMAKAMQSLVLAHQSSIETTHDLKSIKPNHLILFDRDEGGIGIAEAVFTRIHDCLILANAILESCKCTSGCEDCIFETTCREFNNGCDKSSAKRVLRHAMKIVGCDQQQQQQQQRESVFVRNQQVFVTTPSRRF